MPLPPPPPVVSETPAGSVTLRAAGWRVTAPAAALLALAMALVSRLVALEQRTAADERWRVEYSLKLTALEKQIQTSCAPPPAR